MTRALILVALTAAAGNAREIPKGWRWIAAPTLGVQVAAPSDAKVIADYKPERTVHIGNGTFKLNLFVVDGLFASSAADQKALIECQPGFVKFTHQESGVSRWRFDYQLSSGNAATVSRINPGRAFDCGVFNVPPEVVAAVAAACASAKRL